MWGWVLSGTPETLSSHSLRQIAPSLLCPMFPPLERLKPQAGRGRSHSQTLWPLPPSEGSKIQGGVEKRNPLFPAEKSFLLQLRVDPGVLNWP